MHFFYLDETGYTGADLDTPQQPIFVLGGVSVKDEGWRETYERFSIIIKKFFDGAIPREFELHAAHLLSGQGAFLNVDRNALAHDLLDLIVERKHAIHFIGIDKVKLKAAITDKQHPLFDIGIPYLLAFNYMIGYIERYVKQKLGRSARGMIILDQKEDYQPQIDKITHFRRYDVAKARRLKWLVEFSYPIDSAKHPMVQLSDLVIILTRKFLEADNGYKPDWNADARDFFASCYAKIIDRVNWINLISIPGTEEALPGEVLASAHCTHKRNWKQRYNISRA
jgi:hypothetical protein